VNDTIEKKNNIILDFLTGFIRIRGVFNWSAISFMGFILGISSLDLSDFITPLLVFIVATFCITAFTFGINNYYDIESDKKNPRRRKINAMASGKISKQTGFLLNIIFVIIPLIVSILFKFRVFLFCAVLLFWMWIYSSPPLRLKGRPGIDVIWHFFAFVLLIIWGSFIADSVEMINWLVAISFGIFSCIAQVDNHIRDYSYDKKTGTMTYAVWLGLDNAKKTLRVIFMLHIIFLLPLIFLYSLSYFHTIIIIFGGAIGGILISKTKKDSSISPLYHTFIIFGLTVYLSCVVYHISVLFNLEPIWSLI